MQQIQQEQLTLLISSHVSQTGPCPLSQLCHLSSLTPEQPCKTSWDSIRVKHWTVYTEKSNVKQETNEK